jgi:hypothetical protein
VKVRNEARRAAPQSLFDFLDLTGEPAREDRSGRSASTGRRPSAFYERLAIVRRDPLRLRAAVCDNLGNLYVRIEFHKLARRRAKKYHARKFPRRVQKLKSEVPGKLQVLA